MGFVKGLVSRGGLFTAFLIESGPLIESGAGSNLPPDGMVRCQRGKGERRCGSDREPLTLLQGAP